MTADTQYVQRYDESVYVSKPVLVPGLRGRARAILHYPDPMTEPPLGPIGTINNGYNFLYLPQRVRSYTPATATTTVYRNGKFVSQKQYQFKARQIGELSVNQCK